MSSKNVYTLFKTLREYLSEETVQLDISLPEEENVGEIEAKEARWVDNLSDSDPGVFNLKLVKSQFKSPKKDMLQEQGLHGFDLPWAWKDKILALAPPAEPVDSVPGGVILPGPQKAKENPLKGTDLEHIQPEVTHPKELAGQYIIEPFEITARSKEEQDKAYKDSLKQVFLPQSGLEDSSETGYTAGRKWRQYGESRMARMLTDVAQEWKNNQEDLVDEKGRWGPIEYWDVSKKGGGEFPPHVSHQSGRDVDIATFLKSKARGSANMATISTVDMYRMYRLAEMYINWSADNPEPHWIDKETGLAKNPMVIFWNQELIDATRKWAEKKHKVNGEWVYKNNVSEMTNDAMFGTCTKRNSREECVKRKKTSDVNRGPRTFRHEPGHANHYHIRTDRSYGKRNKIRYANKGEKPSVYMPPPEPEGFDPKVRMKTAEDEAREWKWNDKTQQWENMFEGGAEQVYNVGGGGRPDQTVPVPVPTQKLSTVPPSNKIKKAAKKKRRHRGVFKKAPSGPETMKNLIKSGIYGPLDEQMGAPMDPIQQQIQMSVMAAQEQLGPLFGQLQGMIVQMRTLNTPAANQEVKKQTNRIELITNDLNDGDIDVMAAIGQLGNIANDMGKKMQKLTQG